MSIGALGRYRILDLTQNSVGNLCCMMLADLGADLIAVEPARSAGGARHARVSDDGRDVAFHITGRNRRSVALNLRDDRARSVFHDLAKTADVVVEGFRPGVMKRLGIDYETLSGLNPRIIVCSISGYGQDGPYVKLAGHDINYISVAGALGMIGEAGGAPAIPMNFVGDYGGGAMHAAVGILAALLAREQTGRGQYIDLAITDGVMTFLARPLAEYLATGTVARRSEYFLNGATPFYNVYQCSDGGWISLGSIEGIFYSNLCRVVGREDWIPHQWNAALYPEMFEHYRATFKTKTRAEWLDILWSVDICAAPIYDLPEVLDDPQVRHREMIVDAPEGSKIPHQLGVAIKLSDTPGSIRRVAPRLGEHTAEVLSELGLDATRVEELARDGAIDIGA